MRIHTHTHMHTYAHTQDSLNFVVHIIREFALLYGPVIILLENLHEFDTWSWQLLAKIAEVRMCVWLVHVCACSCLCVCNI